MRCLPLILSTLILLFSQPAFSDSGVKFLALEAGARPVGMGGAFTAVKADPYSASYNPAAAHGITTFSGSFGHDTYWENRRFETGYATFMKGQLVFNLGLRYSEVSDIEARQSATSEPDYYFNSPDFSFKVAVAYKPRKIITFGLALGWIFEKIDVYRGSALVADLGVQATPVPKLNLGLSVLNLGTKMKINIEEYDIPATIRLGAAYSLDNFTPVIDFIHFDSKLRVHLGGEYTISDILMLRAGYREGYDTKDFSAGAGFVHRNLRIDYAFLPYSDNLGDSHIFSLTFSL